MRVTVNGEVREVGDGCTVAELMDGLGATGRGSAVAVDGAVVTRSSWSSVRLAPDSHVEVVHAVQGG